MRPQVSLCLIVKNEEGNLPACLGPVVGLVGEIIVVDTGSTDRTKETATKLGARVYDFPWVDDFAAARNESLRHATGEWIFWLDADDRIDEANCQRLQALFASLKDENAAYLMKCVCCSSPAAKTAVAVFDHVRLFRNRPGVGWRYRIHEQILPCLEGLNYSVRRSDVAILHVGYQDQEAQERKRERNLRLLQREDAERPNDAFTLFNLAQIHQDAGRLAEAQSYYQRSLRLAQPGQSFVRKLYGKLTQVTRQLGQISDAMQICRHGQSRFPGNPELIFEEAWLLYLFGDVHGTEARLLQLLQGPGRGGTDLEFGDDPGLSGYQARHNLAVLYRDQNRQAEAEMQWQIVLSEQPDFTIARLGLGELYLAQRRWPEMEHVLIRLDADPLTRVEAAVLRAQKHQLLGEFPAARQLLEKSIADAPKAAGPRILLGRLCMEERRDRKTIEKAWSDVLALDPNNAEARQNLDHIRRQES